MKLPVWVSNPTGRKRPLLKRNGKNTPVPWIAGDGPDGGKWSKVDPERAKKADIHELCLICGEPRGEDYIYAMMQGKPFDHQGRDAANILLGIEAPSPTYGHSKCILLACTFCPHLQKQIYPAMLQNGARLTFEELRTYVKEREKVSA